jgi:integrase/recombinase XerD
MDIIEVNHAIDIERPNIPERKPIYLQVDEAKKMLNVVKGENKERDFAIITLFLHCGLRLSELTSIDINHITGEVLSVIGKGNKQRIIPLDDECIKVIEEYLKVRPEIEGEKALFISEQKNRMCNKSVRDVVKKYIGKAGLDMKKYSTHRLRATCATLLSKGNVPVEQIQKLLGHANISTSMRYVGIENKQLKDAVKLNPLNL